jgi:hypothetical protein
MIEKEFDSVDALLSYFLTLLENKKQGVEKENKENNVKVNYESSQEDLIKRLREQNKKYYSENTTLNKQVESLNKALKEASDISDKLSEENRVLLLENQKYAKENASLKGGPYNKDFYISVMNNLGRKIVDEYVLWLNLCKALKLEDTEMYDDINDDMYDKVPE